MNRDGIHFKRTVKLRRNNEGANLNGRHLKRNGDDLQETPDPGIDWTGIDLFY